MKPRLLVPEVVQTSMMDCGPASLKAMLEGWGIPVSYGRLREACQTDVDGTSIDTMEEVGAQLGLETEQIMLPVDHILLSSAQALPAIVVVVHPSGVTHFVIAWRRHCRFVQIMDPAIGRRWISADLFLKELYIHRMVVPALDWREWAGSEQFLKPLQQRLEHLRPPHQTAKRLLSTALADKGWRSIASLDAAIRIVAVLARSGALKSGTQAGRALEIFFGNALDENPDEALVIPPSFWSVSANPDEDAETLLLRGAVLVRVRGRRRATFGNGEPKLSEELSAALKERPIRPLRELLRMFVANGVLIPAALTVAILPAAAGTVIEALLLRRLLDVGNVLVLVEQRLAAVAFLLTFLITFLLLDVPIAAMTLSLGRRLELRLRIAFLAKLPKLNDRYFHSRLTSDMSERSHSMHRVRSWPEIISQFLRTTFTLIFTMAALVWLGPSHLWLVVIASVLTVAMPLLCNYVLAERDLRVRTHAASLSRFYLDAFQGIIPIRTHSAEKALRREHEGLLVEWTRASWGLQRIAVLAEAIQMVTSLGIAVWLSYTYLENKAMIGAGLLLIYWALSLPALGQEIAGLARLYPAYRNIALRLLEPLGALEEAFTEASTGPAAGTSSEIATSVKLELNNVTVRAGGHLILDEINVVIESGSHVAMVGPSGAGKSSLVGLFLGWHRPAAGDVLVDGVSLEGARLERLRMETAWVDPAVQLWNRSLMENLTYGTQDVVLASMSHVVESASLSKLLEELPDGLQTRLGEGGALVSGGEGQRVRLGRAMLKRNARLVILDEPFRGLDRDRRRELLSRSREMWRGATLLCITHDVAATLAFERVLVIDSGRIVEDGKPLKLSNKSHSRYRRLLEAEEEVREDLWSGVEWRRLRMERGSLIENEAGVTSD